MLGSSVIMKWTFLFEALWSITFSQEVMRPSELSYKMAIDRSQFSIDKKCVKNMLFVLCYYKSI